MTGIFQRFLKQLYSVLIVYSGMMYGDCFPYCPGQAWPTTFTPPPCPSTSSKPTSSVCETTICADYIASCPGGDIGYGTCYPACPGYPTPTPTPPPCPSSLTSSKPTTSSCDITICADYIQSCPGGDIGYGTCYPACSGYPTPTPTPPPCPSTSSKPTTSSCDLTICADYTNSCGGMWGTCYPACPGYPTPTPSIPPCSSTRPYITKPSSSTKKTTTSCDLTICADYTNSCGLPYGTCYPACPGYPTPTPKPPPCPSTKISVVTIKPTVTPKPTKLRT